MDFEESSQEKTYLANTCGKCKKFIGEFFLHDYL